MPFSIRSAAHLALIGLLCVTLTGAPQAFAAGTAEDVKARTLFKEGEKLYNAGNFTDALGRYTEAYELSQLPGFLFNIAQCHRQLGQYERAAFFYGRFVDLSKPHATNVELAAKLRDEMIAKDADRRGEEKRAEEKRIADEAEAKRAAETKATSDAPLAVDLKPRPQPDPIQLPPPPPPPAPETPAYKKGWFWVVVGVGVVAIAGGITAGVIASQPKSPQPAPPLSMTTLPPIDAR